MVNGFDILLETSVDLIFLFDTEGVISNVSKSAEEVLGYSQKEMVGKEFMDFVYPPDILASKQILKDVQAGKKITNFTHRCLSSSGKLIYLSWSGGLVPDSAQIFGIARNITDQKAKKKKKLDRIIKVQSLLDHSPDLIWSLDKNYRLVQGNKAFYQTMIKVQNWKIQPGDFLLSSEHFSEEYIDFWKQHYSKALSGNKVKIEIETESTNQTTPIHFETKINPIKEKGEIVGLACFSRDITEKKHAEKKINELNDRLLKGQEISKVGYWESDLQNQTIFWSEEMYKIWEVENSSKKISFDYFFETIHPEDKQNFLYHRNRALTKEKNLDIVYRIQLPNKNIKYIHEIGELVDDPKIGKRVFRGTAQEVTQAKETEAQLKERNIFIESTLNNLPLGIAVNKLSDGEATYMNSAFEEIYGWPKTDLVEFKSIFQKVFPNSEVRTNTEKMIMDGLQSGCPEKMIWKGIPIITKNGEKKIVNAKNIPVPDLNLMISTVADDTERTFAENELRISNERFKLVSEAISDAIWDWDLTQNTIFWGRGYHTLFGFPEDMAQVDENAWFENIHPEDYPEIWKSILEARENPDQKYWSGEYRFRKYDGTYAYVFEKTVIIRDDTGKVTRMVGALQDITKDKETENYLKLLNSVVTNTTDAILITSAFEKGKGYPVIYSNKAFTEMTGYAEKEIIGKDPNFLQGKESNSTELKKLNQNLRNGKSSKFQIINYRKDGTPFWVDLIILPVSNKNRKITHWIGIQRDITEQKKSEQELKEMIERYKLVSEATNDAIWDWDIQKNIHFWGEGFSKLFGVDLNTKKNSPEEWSSRIHPEESHFVINYLNQLLENKSQNKFSIEYKFRRKDGSYANVLDSGTVIRNKSGKATRLVGAVQDISKRKEYESSLQLLNETLQKANKELEISNKELEQFAYVASHDLQEPLRMISSFLGLIEKKYDSQLDEKGKKYIHFAVEGAKRMRQIIMDLLEFSKLDQMHESKGWIDPQEIIATAKLFQKKNIERKKAVIHIDTLPQIFGHKNSLIQLFQNLISNSLKYQPENQTPEIWIGCKELDEAWEFFFKDNGIGIDNEYLEKIFIIFQRLHTQETFTGTGIGLAISKKIIDIHRGKIWAQSQPGKGSTFFFTLEKPHNP